MTEKQLKAKGYELIEGSYEGTTDDRAGRWYIIKSNAGIVDKRGPGYPSKAAALRAAEEL